MADNVTLNAGTGGAVVRTKDHGSVETQIIGIDLNPAGAESLMAGVMPVSDNAGSLTVDNAGTFAVQAAQSGTWATTCNAGTNLNTSLLALESGGNLATIATRTPALGQALAAASVPVVLTAAQVTTLTPVSTVTANIGTSGSLALDATLTGGSQKSKLVDSGGTNVATVSAGGALKVDGSAVTQPVSLASLPALAAGTALIGQTAASGETTTIYQGTTALTPKFKVITASSSGATTVVAAVAAKKIRVLRWRVSANGAVNVKWQSHVTPTDISGLAYCNQYKDVGGGYAPVGHFETVSGEALDINLSGAVAVSGELTYVEVG
jgi:hypothetical protein